MLRVLAALLVLMLGFGRAALAEEVIRNFVSDVTVQTDGSLDVRETITVTAERREIRRGILRDFPTTYRDRLGQQVRVGFEVLAVKRDGAPERWVTENLANGVRIKIGNADVFLNYGNHTYQIDYRTTRQIGFFDGFDELYWNATGNGWTFAIERAEAIIRLPEGASISRSAVYTGRFGESDGDAQVTAASGNIFRAETTSVLAPGEGFTVAAGWQKGVITPPSDSQKRWWWISDNLGYFLLGLTVIGAGLYYFLAWNRVGRDPPAGNIFPLFRPPQGLGPAGVRYVWKQGFDDQGFAAAVVGLAVKGRLRIDDDEGDYSVTRGGAGKEPLTRTETQLLQSLPQTTLKLKKGNHVAVNAARDAIESALDDEYDGTMFVKNIRWFVLGAVISAVGLLLAGFMMPEGEGAIVFFTTLFSTIWWGVILAVGWATVQGLMSGRGFLTKIRSLMGLIFLLPFVAGGILVPVVTWFSTGATSPMLIFIGGAILVAFFNLLFYWLLKAPTPKGRAILDQIEGFRMYMTTAEEERLKVLHPPEKTPELFERYLPYAIALDCENEWNAKFAAVLAAATAAGVVAGTSPSWYHGSNWDSGNFSRDLSSGLTSSISSASVAPGSSSGSGGGGSSGGGGGGGGGSGW
jgi:uncharacterized membrane protein YgcG